MAETHTKICNKSKEQKEQQFETILLYCNLLSGNYFHLLDSNANNCILYLGEIAFLVQIKIYWLWKILRELENKDAYE